MVGGNSEGILAPQFVFNAVFRNDDALTCLRCRIGFVLGCRLHRASFPCLLVRVDVESVLPAIDHQIVKGVKRTTGNRYRMSAFTGEARHVRTMMNCGSSIIRQLYSLR